MAKKQPQQRKLSQWVILTLVIGLIITGGGYWWYRSKTAPSKYDTVAQCITEKGVKMYGAYWCPVCQSQKRSFGNAWRYIDYIECSLPNATGQTKQCNEAGIEKYPTWDLPAQGSESAQPVRLTGEIAPEELAQKVDCTAKLP